MTLESIKTKTTTTTTNHDHDVISTNDREVQFLARQNDRLSKLQRSSKNVDEESKTRRKDFWREFKRICQSLHDQLNNIIIINPMNDDNDINSENNNNTNNNNDIIISGSTNNIITASQRNVALSKLHSVQATITILSSYYSQASSANKVHHHTTTTRLNETQLEQENHPLPKVLMNVEIYTELPPADLRLLEQEFKVLTTKAQEISQLICPKEKFRFKRYHNLLLQKKKGFDITTAFQRECQNYQGHNNNNNNNNKDHDETKTKEKNQNITTTDNNHTQQIEFHGLKVVSHKNCNISIKPDGSYTTNDNTDDNDDDDINETSDENKETLSKSTAFLIRDLDGCNVNMSGKYNSVHIINVRNGSKILIQETVTGPIHVTNCHNTTIISASRQLRIHECDNVNFHIHVFSGPIIEDCKKMSFHGDYSEQRIIANNNNNTKKKGQRDTDNKQEEKRQTHHTNMYWDVKDFNWLKPTIPSPNFIVIRKEELKDTQNESFVEEHTTHNESIIDSVAPQKQNDNNSDEESEDEL